MMDKANLNGVELEYETVGSGEPVVLIHGSIVGDAYVPMMAEPSLRSYKLIRYRRQGFGGSTHPASAVSIRDQAADCLALMRHLHVSRARVVGHSYGGVVGLQLALDHPKEVYSLALLEPALVGLIASSATLMQELEPAIRTYEQGDKLGALDAFLNFAVGPDYREPIDRIPGAWEMALADTDNFFRIEVPALGEWRFAREDAARTRQPVLAVLGGDSRAFYREIHDLVRLWIPQARPVTIPGVNHMLEAAEPRIVAEALAEFFASHPMR
jgi:pimeloyl-ACP methyl ester carboxylesterase